MCITHHWRDLGSDGPTPKSRSSWLLISPEEATTKESYRLPLVNSQATNSNWILPSTLLLLQKQQLEEARQKIATAQEDIEVAQAQLEEAQKESAEVSDKPFDAALEALRLLACIERKFSYHACSCLP